MNAEQRKRFLDFLYKASIELHNAYRLAEELEEYNRKKSVSAAIDKLDALMYIEKITKVETN